jgi:carbon-monoxide dehydrogenase large subunit
MSTVGGPRVCWVLSVTVSILGTRVLRTEDPKFLTVGGTYVADLGIEGAVAVTYVRATMAHARITSIDISEALAAPGVIGVFTAADIDLAPLPAVMGMAPAAFSRPFLATGVVRFVGEPVAVVLTERRDQGEDAIELVYVDYDPLPAVAELADALAGDILLFPEAGSNTVMGLADLAAMGMLGENPVIEPDEHLFDGCDVVVRQEIVNRRVAPCPLEVRGSIARWEADGRLTFWTSTQAPHGGRGTIARIYGLEETQVHVIAPDVGGGFGAKIASYPEELLLPWLARRVGRPVAWTETRSESMVGLGHGRGQRQVGEMGGTRDGRIQAYRLRVLQEAGAYPDMAAFLPFFTRAMLPGVYDIERLECHFSSLVTNTTPVVAYRGAGRPEAAAAVERMIDVFAAELGMDPAEVRRRNFIPPFSEPIMTPVGSAYDSGAYEAALDRALETAGYADLRAEQSARRAAGDPVALGIGLAVYVEVTGGGIPGEYGSVEIRPDGSALVRTGSSPHGQGHATAWSMLVSDQTGIPMDRIEVVHGDTDLVPRGNGTMGSHSLQHGGVAVLEATQAVVEQARNVAAQLLEASPDDIVVDTASGRLHVIGTPTAGRTWAEVASAAAPNGGMSAEVDMASKGNTYPFGAHVAVVDVDTETGKVVVRRLIAVDDAGRLLNPLLAEGQVHGGLAQGIAQALLEEVRYDGDANPLTTNLADYTFVSAAELPSFETVHMETPTPLNVLGAKGIGESGSIGATPAVQNAVVDALAHLGVRHVDMPTTPERVWAAIREATA